MRLAVLLVHPNCPNPTGPKGSLLAFEGGHANTDGARYRCVACGMELIAIALPHDDLDATWPDAEPRHIQMTRLSEEDPPS